MIKNRATTRLGYLLITMTILLMGAVISFAIYAHKKDFGYLKISFPKTGTLLIEEDFTVYGRHYGKIIDIDNTKTGEALVTVKLKEPLTVYKGYKVYVYDVGLFGKRAICMENGLESNPVENTQHTLKGIYYPGIADILGSMHKLRKAFDDLQELVQIAYGDNPNNARIVVAIENIKTKTDRITTLSSELLTQTGISLKTGIPSLRNTVQDGSNTLDKLTKTLDKADKFNKGTMVDAHKLLKEAMELDSSLTLLAQDIESGIEVVDTLNSETLLKKLVNIENQINMIGSDAHKLKLIIKRYNSED